MYNAIFNSNNLGVGDYFISSIDVKMPKSNVSKYELVRADGQIVTSKFYGERKIIIKGRINASSLEDMQTKLDTLKVWTLGYEKPLDISIGNTNRRYIATVDEFITEINGYDCTYTINFTCNAIGYEPSMTSLTFGTYTATNTSYTNTIGGTYKTSPYIDLTFNSLFPYWSNKYIQIKNPVTNQRMRITRQWLFGDRVVIDGFNKTCRIYAGTKTLLDNFDSITGMLSGDTLSQELLNMLEGTGCAKVVMGSAGTASYLNKLNNTATFDLSSTAGKVLIPVFIPTPTSGTVSSFRFNIGSDATLSTNSCYWDLTTQYDGSAIATNAWNYFLFDLSATPTSTTGTPNRTAIISWSVRLMDGSNFQLNGWLMDYMIIVKTNPITSGCDYEGTFIDLEPNSSSIVVEDEFTARNVTITGGYYKRFI